jgi:ABC-type multidrug transport system fused ATPase/permease subunit
MACVFLSHNSADKPAVEEIARRLRDEGIDPWIDTWQLVPGEKWQPSLEKALAEARASVVFFGPSGIGPWQDEEMRVAIDRRVREPSFRVVPVLLPGARRTRRSLVPPFMANVMWVEFHGSLDDDEAFRRLVAGIEGRPPSATSGPEPSGANPYKGLEPFDVVDAPQFFGRQAMVGWLVSAVRASVEQRGEIRFLAVVGPSGSGKSSLARAGLVAALRAGEIEGSAAWRYVIFKPGADPLQALATAASASLRLLDGTSVVAFQDNLKADARLLHAQASLAMRDEPAHARLVLLVDQFEEIFTLCEPGAPRDRFIENLLNAATAVDGPVIVIVTLRSDFVGHCAAHEHLAAVLSDHQQLVGPMRREELREAIEQPAFRSGCEFQPGLVEVLLDDVDAQPGALPLLQHALFELWGKRDGRRLTHEAYERIGRVQGALARRAQKVYSDLTPPEQVVARRVLLRLIQPGEGTDDTRRRASFDEVLTQADDRAVVERVVRRLVDARLLVTTGAALDVAHEALIRAWPQLRAWIDEQRAALRFHRRIAEAAQEWQRLHGEDGALFRGALLEEARVWRSQHEPDLNPGERAFLDASSAFCIREKEAKAYQRTQSDRMVWLQWSLANALGTGIGLAAALMSLHGLVVLGRYLPSSSVSLHESVSMMVLAAAVAIFLSAVFGGVLGAAQWSVAGKLMATVRAGRWLVATALGTLLGMLVVSAVGMVLRPDDPLDSMRPIDSYGAVVAATAIALLVLFVRHRAALTGPWSERSHRLHWAIVVAFGAGLVLAFAPDVTSELVIMGRFRLREVAVAAIVATTPALLAWHHLSESRPRTLGRLDLYGAFIAAMIVVVLAAYLFRAAALREYVPGDTYGLGSPVLTVVLIAVVGGAIGSAQGWISGGRLGSALGWALACALGMAIGVSTTAVLIPEIGPGIASAARGGSSNGLALFIFFAPVGLMMGAVTGKLLIRSNARGAREQEREQEGAPSTAYRASD